jgi:hypothetical protein
MELGGTWSQEQVLEKSSRHLYISARSCIFQIALFGYFFRNKDLFSGKNIPMLPNFGGKKKYLLF